MVPGFPMAFTQATDVRSNCAQGFTTTHWSVVLGAADGDSLNARAALEQLCGKYWYPLYAFVRRRGWDPHDAADLTQAFFAFLLEKETLKRADRERGRFRSFLLAALDNFLNNEHHKQHAIKRGGRCPLVSLDASAAEEKYCVEATDSLTPEKLFERRWTTTLLEQVLARLKQEFVAGGKARLFETLEPGLTGELAEGAYAQWSMKLGMSPGAVKVALHRLRRRFGEALRHEIAHTVADPAEVDEEIRHLFTALSR
jgi:DNA-directed RNA polymerase specialized sigma24 family protein